MTRSPLGIGGLTPQIEVTRDAIAAPNFVQKWSDTIKALGTIWLNGLQTGDDGNLHTLTFTPKVPPDLITDPQIQGLDPTGPLTKPDLWRGTYEGRVKLTEIRLYPPAEAVVATDWMSAVYAANASLTGVFTPPILCGQRYNGDIYYQPIAGGSTPVKVLTKQQPGWFQMTGTATRTAFGTYVPPAVTPGSSSAPTSTPDSYTAVQIGALMTEVQKLSERLKALTDDLGAGASPTSTVHGLIGA